MTRDYAMLRIAVRRGVDKIEAAYLFEERVGIKQEGGASEGVAMREAYRELTGDVVA